MFPISRDPPEGGTWAVLDLQLEAYLLFPICRDPPEGGTQIKAAKAAYRAGFQFLGIPPKGERLNLSGIAINGVKFPISRDPPEGGTMRFSRLSKKS